MRARCRFVRTGLTCTALLVGMGQVHAQSESGFVRLKGAEIRRTLIGKNLSDEVHWSFHYNANGTVTGMSMGRKVESRWRLAGDELCETERSQPEACYEVWKRKGEVQLRPRGAGLPLEGTLR